MMTLGDNESLKIFLNLFQTKDILNYLLFQYLGKIGIFLEQKVVMIFYTIKKRSKLYASKTRDGYTQ